MKRSGQQGERRARHGPSVFRDRYWGEIRSFGQGRTIVGKSVIKVILNGREILIIKLDYSLI